MRLKHIIFQYKNRIQKCFFLLIFQVFIFSVFAQNNVYNTGKYQFLSYGAMLTWTGVAVDWNTNNPSIHLYDTEKYKGHADYISFGLKRGISFKQFKEDVRLYKTRKYLPFLLFDLRDKPPVIKGNKYYWALQIQDYRYDDTSDQMAETTLKLLNLVTGYIRKQSPLTTSGIIILAKPQNVQPNISIASGLQLKGFPSKTISELIEASGGVKLQVLNAGISTGYLRYISLENIDNTNVSYKDIVIYEQLPSRVPLVGGFISLEPQTPLSHINLLAKNRGTTNIYTTDLKYIPGAKEAINKLVKLECTDTKIKLTEISENEAAQYWAKHLVSQIAISPPEEGGKEILYLSSAPENMLTIAKIGTKAANYAVIEKNFPCYVRKGCVIPFSWYLEHIKTCGADQLIAGLDGKNEQEQLQIIEKIQHAIKSSPLDSKLIALVRGLIITTYKDEKIRLRSSTNCEDLPDFNGAGLYLSKGFKNTDSDLELRKSICEIYASLWSEPAFKERQFYGIDHSKTAMAILINEAFTNEYANGVVLTLKENNHTSMIINSQLGNISVTNPPHGMVSESIIVGDYNISDRKVESKSSAGNVFVENTLLEPVLKDLISVTKQIEVLLLKRLPPNINRQYGVDIEFKIMNNARPELVIKQARLLGEPLPE
jgi:hypothetical protein